jgi:hypothetical protein
VAIGPTLRTRRAVVTAAHGCPRAVPGATRRHRAVLLTAPRDLGGGIGDPAPHHEVAADNQQVGLTTSDQPPARGEAHVYRVTASQHGQVFGGYTVVLLG